MAGRVDRLTGRGGGPTGAGKGAGTGTAATDGVGAVDTLEQDPTGAGGGCLTTQEKARMLRRNRQWQYPYIRGSSGSPPPFLPLLAGNSKIEERKKKERKNRRTTD